MNQSLSFFRPLFAVLLWAVMPAASAYLLTTIASTLTDLGAKTGPFSKTVVLIQNLL